jgi:hypothetical protein
MRAARRRLRRGHRILRARLSEISHTPATLMKSGGISRTEHFDHKKITEPPLLPFTWINSRGIGGLADQMETEQESGRSTKSESHLILVPGRRRKQKSASLLPSTTTILRPSAELKAAAP